MKTRNHYVSRCYLKMWENPNKDLFEYKKNIPNSNFRIWSKRKPSQIGFLNNFYIFFNKNESKEKEFSDIYEEIFSKNFENELGKILEKIDKDQNLEPNELDILFKFIAVQRYKTIDGFFRTMDIITQEEYEQEIMKVIKESDNDYQNGRIGSKLNLTKKNDVLSPLDADIIPNQGVKITYIKGRNNLLICLKRLMDNVYKCLYNHCWTILKAPDNKEWITSDNPIITKKDLNQNNIYNFEGGFDEPQAEIMVPISPKYLLYTKIGFPLKCSKFQVNDEIYESIIKLICENATESIYSRSENSLVRKYAGLQVNDDLYKYFCNLDKTLFETYKNIEIPFLKKIMNKREETKNEF